jgi:hypothetical protein
MLGLLSIKNESTDHLAAHDIYCNNILILFTNLQNFGRSQREYAFNFSVQASSANGLGASRAPRFCKSAEIRLLSGHGLACSFLTVAELFQWTILRQWGDCRIVQLGQYFMSGSFLAVQLRHGLRSSHQHNGINDVNDAVICFDIWSNYGCVFDFESIEAVDFYGRSFD